MDGRSIQAMAERVAENSVSGKRPAEEVAAENVDQALDAMVAAVQTLEENMPLLKPDSVPRRAALDAAKDTLATGVSPYLAELIKLLDQATDGG